LFNDPDFLKVILVRNPVTRLLSAWLDKREDPSEWFSVFYTTSFADFVAHPKRDPRALHSNEHFRPQADFCDLPSGARYDFVAKVEERMEWAWPLFEYLNLTDFAARNWGTYDLPCSTREAQQGAALLKGGICGEECTSLRWHSVPPMLGNACAGITPRSVPFAQWWRSTAMTSGASATQGRCEDCTAGSFQTLREDWVPWLVAAAS